MKYVKYILVLFFAYFICVLNVYAENSDYIYVKRYAQYFHSDLYRSDYHNYIFNSNDRLFTGNQPVVGVVLHADSLLNIANTYNVTGTIVINMFNQPLLVPTGGLDSCVYLAQNSNIERDALASCFNVSIDTSNTSISFTDLYIDIIPSESTTWQTSESGDTTVNYSNGYQYTIKYSFNFNITEVNRDYDYTFNINMNGGYLLTSGPSDIVSVLITTPKINTIPYFSADNPLFTNFFSNMNFNFHGLTSVITAPVYFINSLKSSPPSTLRFTLFNKNIDIPNGETLFWNRTDVSQFKGFWNYLIGGAIIYLVYKRLFYYIFNLFNPDKSEVKSL